VSAKRFLDVDTRRVDLELHFREETQMLRFALLLALLVVSVSQSAVAQQLRLVKVERTGSFGGPGGGNYEISFPFGSVMIGLRARHGAWIDALAPICARWVRSSRTLGEIDPQPFTGGRGGGEAFMRCQGPRGVVVGLELMRADNEWASVGHIIINCGDYLDPKSSPTNCPAALLSWGRPRHTGDRS
jgi:hypothetical protein